MTEEKNSVLSLRLTSEDRFLVRIGLEERTGETYYLGLDPENAGMPMSVTRGLNLLLKGWLHVLESINDGDLIYLPFDFSDEYTRWVACQMTGHDIHIVMGWAAVEGWAISPSNFESHARSVSQFQPDEPLTVQSFYLPRFLSELRREIGKFEARLRSATA
ncbi:MAG: hypothetical protein KDA91_19255 [Planctomycetaceae bacterium]|nr:hypothetical protein [Planctomycetaceae bacterium]